MDDNAIQKCHFRRASATTVARRPVARSASISGPLVSLVILFLALQPSAALNIVPQRTMSSHPRPYFHQYQPELVALG